MRVRATAHAVATTNRIAPVVRVVSQGDFTQYHVDWDGRLLIVPLAAPEPMAEGDRVFVSADPRHCVLLEE